MSHVKINYVVSINSITNLIKYNSEISQADYIELRLDYLVKNAEIEQTLHYLKNASKLPPLLIVVRNINEGGVMAISQEKRLKLLIDFLPWAQLIDIELADITDFARLRGYMQPTQQLILSYHNFQLTPSHQELVSIVENMAIEGADIAKLALMHQQASDIDILRQLLITHQTSSLHNKSTPLLACMGMGDVWGQASRLVYLQGGSYLNYCYVGNQPTAPGQWQLSVLQSCANMMTGQV